MSVTIKGAVLAEILKGNPGQKIKSVDYDQYGSICRIEWYENEHDAPWKKLRDDVEGLREEFRS